MNASRSLLFAALALAALPAAALDLRVGAGSGCTHATVQAALSALEGVGGDHTIRINAVLLAVPDGLRWTPRVAQGTLTIEGGYASCTAPSPGGRSVLDGTAGLLRPVLTLNPFPPRGTGPSNRDRIILRRIEIRGGDAVDADVRFQFGGGVAVRGEAEISLGLGMLVHKNRAVGGGGLALIGSETQRNEPLLASSLALIDGATIRENNANGAGGGIYCGGAITAGTFPAARHGLVELGDSVIAANQAPTGSAIECVGSWAAGGVRWQVPDDRSAAILDNIGTRSDRETCAVRTRALQSRQISGGPKRNGHLLVQGNRGFGSAGLCLVEPATRGGASPAPFDPPLIPIEIDNARFVGNRVAWTQVVSVHTSALRSTPRTDSSEHTVRWWPAVGTASIDSVRTACRAMPYSSCLVFEANGPIGDFPALNDGPVVAVVAGRGEFEGARFVQNDSRGALISTFNPGDRLTLISSIIDRNVVSRGEASIALVRNAGGAAASRLALWHSTITLNSHAAFVSVNGPGRAELRGSLLHSPSGTTRPVRIGNAAASATTLTDCLYLPSLADPSLIGTSRGTDPPGPVLLFDGPLTLPADFTPPSRLRDQCRTPIYVWSFLRLTIREYYGLARPGGDPSLRVSDIGAVEVFP